MTYDDIIVNNFSSSSVRLTWMNKTVTTPSGGCTYLEWNDTTNTQPTMATPFTFAKVDNPNTPSIIAMLYGKWGYQEVQVSGGLSDIIQSPDSSLDARIGIIVAIDKTDRLIFGSNNKLLYGSSGKLLYRNPFINYYASLYTKWGFSDNDYDGSCYAVDVRLISADKTETIYTFDLGKSEPLTPTHILRIDGTITWGADGMFAPPVSATFGGYHYL